MSMQTAQQSVLGKIGAANTTHSDGLLHQAHAALDAGDVGTARSIADSVLQSALQTKDIRAEARTLAFVAHCDRVVSRIRDAHRTSRHAAQLFHTIGDPGGEAMALSIQANVASALGYNEEAVEAGLLGVRLAGLAGSSEQQAIAGIHLGNAYFFSRNFEKADEAFVSALKTSTDAVPPLNIFQVCVMRACALLARVAWTRYHTGRLVDLQPLRQILDTCYDLADSGKTDAIAKGVRVSLQAIWRLCSSIAFGWEGKPAAAAAELRVAQEWLARYGLPTWLDAFAEFARGERAWAEQDWKGAEFHAGNAVRLSAQLEHEQFACLSHLLEIQVFEAQGKIAEALEVNRSLRRREERMRAESLQSRAQAVEWQLALRRGERELLALQASSRKLERQSIEDPLTSIPNRRGFEQYIVNALAVSRAAGSAMSVALFDVDHFKQINDTHSHQVGDEVLKVIAGLLERHAAALHFPARLAGDEFVMAFTHASHADAMEACERIQSSVRAFNWNSVGCNLAVTISVGVAQGLPGEDADSLLRRSDAAMYEAKRDAARRAPPSHPTGSTLSTPLSQPDREGLDTVRHEQATQESPLPQRTTGSAHVESSRSSFEIDDALVRASAALDEGDVGLARHLANKSLQLAKRNHDEPARARALMALGNCDRIVSKFRRAHETYQRAAQLSQEIGDVKGESAALSALAYTSTCLGRNEEAVEAALLGVSLLRETVPPPLHEAHALNYLGVAYLWGRDFANADASLDAAERALTPHNASAAFQPLVNRLWACVVQEVTERFQTGMPAQTTAMSTLEARCATLARDGAANALAGGQRVTGVALWLLGIALLRCWEGRCAEALVLLEQATDWSARYRTLTWLEVFENWVRMEVCWARSDWAMAQEHCTKLVDLAERLEYEQLVCLGHAFASQIHEKAGERSLALTATRKVRERDEMIRADALANRERVVEWRLRHRRIESSVRTLSEASARLERLSLEDPLTSIANRRQFELQLASMLEGSRQSTVPTSIAFMDVDRFKQINDTHSHDVGDQVLQAIARVLSESLREQDLPARLAGDEFAILFGRTSAGEVQSVCERIASRVASFAWNTIAEGLSVSISIGTATSRPGDTASSLLDRSDSEMYATKRRGRVAK